MPAKRNRPFIRQWKILGRLAESHYGATYRDLKNVLEPDDHVVLRTIQRDVKALEDAGFQVYSEMCGKQVVWLLSRKSSLPLPLDARELIALHSAKLFAQQQRLPGADAFASFCRKIFAGLTEQTRRFLKNVEAAVLVGGPRTVPSVFNPRDVEEQISDAILNHRSVGFVYEALSTGQRRRFQTRIPCTSICLSNRVLKVERFLME